MNKRKKAIFWKIDLRVKPNDIVIYEDSYYLNKNGINSNPLNDSNWLYLGDVTKKILQFTFSNNGTLENEYDMPLSVVKNLSFSGVDFEYEINEEENVLLIKLNQNKKLREVTYDELVNLKNTSSLVKGQNYLLTDYMTTYEQPITGLMKSSGIVEPLIITATDVNKLHNQCKSTLYPQDIVFYEITGDIEDYYGTEGFTKGKIYRRIDTLRNNDIGTDWRHVKYDRNGVDKLLFEDYTDCFNNVIKTYFLHNTVVGSGFSVNTIGAGFSGNTIGVGFSGNTIGVGFSGNTVRDGFYGNTVGNNFSSNTVGDIFNGNTVGDDFSGNTVGDVFNGNIVGVGFSNNTVGDGFSANTVGSNFSGNGNPTTLFLAQNTEFKNNISNSVSTTEIQNPDIDVVVFKSPNGTKKQRYYDDSNNLVINNL